MREKVENIALLATVVASVLVALLDLFGLVESIPWLTNRIPTITLLILAILASYLISERSGEREELKGLKTLISENTKVTIASLSGVEASTKLSAEEGYEYIAKIYETAQRSIDAAILAPVLSRGLPRKVIDEAFTKMLKANKVNCRYITYLDNAQWERMRPYITDSANQKLYFRYFEPIRKPPLMSFLIIDNQEVYMRYPHEPGEPEIYLSVKHPEVVQLFAAYFTSMWREATFVSGDNRRKLEEIERRFSSSSELNE